MWCNAVGCIVTLLLSLLTAPLAIEAQPMAKLPRVGVLSAGFPPGGSDPAAFEAFRQGLRDLGYVEGQTIVVEYRWAEGQGERLPDLAAELVGLPVDLIVAGTTRVVQSAQRATRTIPIVMALSADPVASGFVGSLARQGAKPADLPVEQPTQFELVLNLQTAEALGLALPQHLLVFTDEVIR